jgi:hypothetical protein
VFLATPFNERWGRFSPDGRWVAYGSNESGKDEVYVRRFVEPTGSTSPTASGAQWQVSTSGGSYPVWGHDGAELHYLDPSGRMMSVSIKATGDRLEPGPPVALFRTQIYGGGTDNQQGPQYDVARNGRFLINTTLDDAVAPITLIQNWRPQ